MTTTHPTSIARILTVGVLAFALLLLAAACGPADEPDSGATSIPTATATPPPTMSPVSDDGDQVVLELHEFTRARYLIREELINVELPFDATGETTEITGAFTFTADGAVVPDGSRLVLNAASLKSDDENRDNYLSRNAIMTGTYPEIIFVATDVVGLEWPLPASGDAEFTIVGDLTVRDVTRPVEWATTATFADNTVAGVARTNFTFGEFEMEVPSLYFIVSLEDNIRLEFDFVAGW